MKFFENLKDKLAVEIPVLDMEKAINFYEGVFNWKFDMDGDTNYASYNLNDYNIIGIFKTEKIRPKGLNVILGVENIDGVLKRLVKEEGKIIKPKTPAQEMGSFSVVQDCFGNEFSIFSEEK